MPTITIKNWRGSYMARLDLNDRGTFDREWGEVSKIVKGKPGTPSVRYYNDLEPGWYETREGYRTYKGQDTPKQYHRVDELTATEITLTDVVAAITGPLPGQPGEWATDMCECGEPVASYTIEGYPKCETHTKARTVADTISEAELATIGAL